MGSHYAKAHYDYKEKRLHQQARGSFAAKCFPIKGACTFDKLSAGKPYPYNPSTGSGSDWPMIKVCVHCQSDSHTLN
jgi:hypothetical protein